MIRKASQVCGKGRLAASWYLEAAIRERHLHLPPLPQINYRWIKKFNAKRKPPRPRKED